MLKAVLDAPVLVEEGRNVTPFFREFCNHALKFLCALPHFANLMCRGNDFLKDGGAGGKVCFLLEVAHLSIFCKLDRTSVRGIDAHDDLEQRCLARSVRSYKCIALPCIDLERSAVKQYTGTKAFFDFICKQNHESSLSDVVEN